MIILRWGGASRDARFYNVFITTGGWLPIARAHLCEGGLEEQRALRWVLVQPLLPNEPVFLDLAPLALDHLPKQPEPILQEGEGVQ